MSAGLDVRQVLDEVMTRGDLDPTVEWDDLLPVLDSYIDEVLGKYFDPPLEATVITPNNAETSESINGNTVLDQESVALSSEINDANEPSVSATSSDQDSTENSSHEHVLPNSDRDKGKVQRNGNSDPSQLADGSKSNLTATSKPYYTDPLTKDNFTREYIISELKKLLQSHDRGPPFTIQRFAELLLRPNAQYPRNQEPKYLMALTRVLNVESCTRDFEQIDLVALSEERELEHMEREAQEEQDDDETDFPFPIITAAAAAAESAAKASGSGTVTAILPSSPGTQLSNSASTDDKIKDDSSEEVENTSEEFSTPHHNMIATNFTNGAEPSTPSTPSSSSKLPLEHLNSVVVMSPIPWITESSLKSYMDDLGEGDEDLLEEEMFSHEEIEQHREEDSHLKEKDELLDESIEPSLQRQSQENENQESDKADQDVEMADADNSASDSSQSTEKESETLDKDTNVGELANDHNPEESSEDVSSEKHNPELLKDDEKESQLESASSEVLPPESPSASLEAESSETKLNDPKSNETSTDSSDLVRSHKSELSIDPNSEADREVLVIKESEELERLEKPTLASDEPKDPQFKEILHDGKKRRRLSEVEPEGKEESKSDS